MKILITGSAGFIGSALSIQLLNRGDLVVGVDNHNPYYDPKLKESRLARHKDHENYTHYQISIEDKDMIDQIFTDHSFDVVVNMAAQPGVRYSITNPRPYIETNIVGFSNILEACRHNQVGHFVYASSSSIYGLNTNLPYSVHNEANHPISLYAASKRANELLAHSYSHLYNIPTTGLRFFTVYGPYDRPDMALQKFSQSIMTDKTIKIFNYGKNKRDFPYIDDIIEGIIRVIDVPAAGNKKWNSDTPDPASSSAPYRVYNIGNHNPVKLSDYIDALENALGKSAKKEFLPIQDGDVPDTFANIDSLVKDFKFKPRVDVEEGIGKFAEWFRKYYDY